jgi:hypothetical protein
MIVDAILFNDELELLQHRIRWLNNYVDVTVILEADFTFSGKLKSLVAKSNLTNLAELTEGLVVPLQMTIETFDINLPDNPWDIELASRDYLLKHLIANHPEDRIIFSDLDEIPSLEQIRVISKLDLDENLETFSIPMQVYYRYANWQQVGSGENWNLAKTFNSSFAPSVAEIRSSNQFSNLPGKGSHLSYLSMTAEQITSKFDAFSHSELSGFRYIEDTLTRISDVYFVDHIGRFDVAGRGLIRVLDKNKVDDICKYLIEKNLKFLRSGETPPTLKRLMASSVITYLRKSKNTPKSLSRQIIEKSLERNNENLGIIPSLVILTHSYFRVLRRYFVLQLKRLIHAQIKFRIKKLYVEL